MVRPMLFRNGNQLRLGSVNGPRQYLRGFCYNEHVISPTANGFPITISPAVTSQAMSNIVAWGFNCTRILLDFDHWLNDAAYRQSIDNTITAFGNREMWVIANLYSRGAIVGDNRMLAELPPDAPTFWTSFANYFKSRSYVIFDILNEYNEGGYLAPTVSELQAWAANMQPSINAIRATGAQHPISIHGLSWAKTFRGALPYLPTDPGVNGSPPNLLFQVHCYKDPPWGVSQEEIVPSGWNLNWKPVADVWPLILGEYGEMNGSSETPGTGQWTTTILPWLEQYGAGWLVWTNRFNFGMAIALPPDGAPNGGHGGILRTYMQDTPIPGGTPAPPGEITVQVPLTLDKATVAAGNTIAGSVTIQNTGGSSISIVAAIGVRPQGISRLQPPYTYDFTPVSPLTLAAGQSTVFTASRIIPATDPAGNYYAFFTYQTPDGVWQQPQPDIAFTVGGSQGTEIDTSTGCQLVPDAWTTGEGPAIVTVTAISARFAAAQSATVDGQPRTIQVNSPTEVVVYLAEADKTVPGNDPVTHTVKIWA
jgi:hypothetical protein